MAYCYVLLWRKIRKMRYQGGDKLKFYKWGHLTEDLRIMREQAM